MTNEVREKRYLDIVEFIKRYVQDNHVTPTVRELGQAVGLSSSSSIHAVLKQMEKRGMIMSQPDKARTIVVLV